MRNAALLASRLVIGGYLAVHGARKLFGAFGGGGLDRTAAGFHRIGLRPGPQMAAAAGMTELGGGLLTAAGIADPAGPLAAASEPWPSLRPRTTRRTAERAGRVRTSAHQSGRGRRARGGGTRPIPPRPRTAAAAGRRRHSRRRGAGGGVRGQDAHRQARRPGEPRPGEPRPGGSEGSADQGREGVRTRAARPGSAAQPGPQSAAPGKGPSI